MQTKKNKIISFLNGCYENGTNIIIVITYALVVSFMAYCMYAIHLDQKIKATNSERIDKLERIIRQNMSPEVWSDDYDPYESFDGEYNEINYETENNE